MRKLACVVIAIGGCAGDITGGGAGPDASPASIAFLSPAPGATLTRDTLADDGWMTAQVPIAVTATGADRIEIDAEGRVLGTTDDAGQLAGALRDVGPATLTARAMRGSDVVATATVDVDVADPTLADCHAALDLYHLQYTLGPSNPGVVDPVTVTTPINGVPYRYVGNTSQRATFFMDCQLALSLAKAAPYFRERGVTEVQDYGLYNYRCIDNEGTPPNCTIGMSQHAYAMAIDLAGFTLADGESMTVTNDFVIDPDGMTCTDPTEPGVDTFLHRMICQLKQNKVWNIVLTPNYNSLHRDHFHVDLTPGADFIRFTGGGLGDE